MARPGMVTSMMRDTRRQFHIRVFAALAALAVSAALAQETTTTTVKGPLDYPVKQYGLILGISLLGGLVAWGNKVRQGHLRAWNLMALIGELATASLAGLLCFVSLIGIPWGRSCFVIGTFTFFPFGKQAVSRKSMTGQSDIGTGALGMIGNILWFLVIGIWLAIGHIASALAWVAQNRSLAGWTGGQQIANDQILLMPCDVLIPAALGGVITKDVAAQVRCRVVAEAANGPTTPEGDEVLRSRDITVIPDIYANAGGVTVSYFEWVQNIQQLPWDETRVRIELERIMRTAFASLMKAKTTHNIDLRTAAFVVAIERVARATAQRGA